MRGFWVRGFGVGFEFRGFFISGMGRNGNREGRMRWFIVRVIKLI